MKTLINRGVLKKRRIRGGILRFRVPSFELLKPVLRLRTQSFGSFELTVVVLRCVLLSIYEEVSLKSQARSLISLLSTTHRGCITDEILGHRYWVREEVFLIIKECTIHDNYFVTYKVLPLMNEIYITGRWLQVYSFSKTKRLLKLNINLSSRFLL